MIAAGLGLVAQCAPSTHAPCELPHGLPWYFGLFIAVVWLGVVVGALALGLRLIRSRRSGARRDVRRRRRSEQRELES